MKWYVGMTPGKFESFQSYTTPTESTHGTRYQAAIGPFRTKRAALWTEQYGYNNPHFRHVNDAERISSHTLIIDCLHDTQAHCTCGNWHYGFTGAMTEDQVAKVFAAHLKRYSQ